MSKYENYGNADALVTTDWVADRLDELKSDDSRYRLVEVDLDVTNYEEGHIPGAESWDWEENLSSSPDRDLAGRQQFQQLLRDSGIDNDTEVILYGDNNNWFATWAYWQLNYYGFENVSIVDGGRELWLEEGRAASTDEPSFSEGDVELQAGRRGLRAKRDYILENLDRDDLHLVDVRSAEEFRGESLGPEGINEGARRGGHIPGAHNISWKDAIADDGTFKSREKLEEIYQSRGIDSKDETIAYCRIGERSSHTWFVLSELLDYDNVRNYDGSWTEWGNLVGVPVETGE